MSSINNLRRVTKRVSDDSELGQYSLEGRPVRCPHCHGAHFKIGEAQLNTAFATLLKLDRTNKSATILICASYGQIQRLRARRVKHTSQEHCMIHKRKLV
jgi:hypothetical protein